MNLPPLRDIEAAARVVYREFQATPCARAAQAMLWPWLPRVALITSRGSSPRCRS